MTEFEQKREAKREAYRERAEGQRAKAGEEFAAAAKLRDLIPFGQPVLSGHHSEGRHRRDLSKIDRHMIRGVEAEKKAEDYERRASRVGYSGVSSDDPDAVAKLTDKLVTLQARRESIRYINQYWREHEGFPHNVDASLKKEGLHNFKFSPAGTDVPFPPWAIVNLGVKIRRLKGRIGQLGADAKRARWPGLETEYVTVEESRPDNLVYFRFKAGKPSQGARALMREHGWHWKPSVEAWSRRINNATLVKAEYTAARVGELLDKEAAGASI